MSKFLPTGDFRWIDSPEEKEKFTLSFIKNLSDTSEKSHFYEVDISYPEKLHDSHNTFPLRPHHKNIEPRHLSKYQNKLAEKLNLKIGGKKLVTTFDETKSYVCHQRNLKQYIELGLEVTKIHRVLEFSQSKWLEPYISKNTQLRQQAQMEGAQDMVDFAKLMNNSGKLSLSLFLPHTHTFFLFQFMERRWRT